MKITTAFFLLACTFFVPFAHAQDTTGTVDFDVDTLRDRDQAIVTLSDESILTLLKIEVIDYGIDAYVWLGAVDAEPASIVVISVDNGTANGTIHTVQRWWEITLAEGISEPVAELDPADFKDGYDISASALRLFKDGFETQPNQIATAQVVVEPDCIDDKPLGAYLLVDVLVVYTAEAASGININNKIRGAIWLANQSFELNKIKINGKQLRLNPVPKELINVPVVTPDAPSTSMSQTLTKLVSGAIKDVDDKDVEEMRDQYAADLVILLTKNVGEKFEEEDYGGLAAGGLFSTPSKEKAFAIVDIDETASFIFTHEVGHLFGAEHDKFAIVYSDDRYSALSQLDNKGSSFGYVNQYDFDNWRTVMSYSTICDAQAIDCPLVNMFSDPENTLLGVAAGTADTNNAAKLAGTASEVACFRQNPKIVDIPFADSALEACVEAQAVAQGWIKAGDVLQIVCSSMGITNLDGIEYLFNVVSVAMENNLISNLTAMQDLVEITNLELIRNNISDISPLSKMSKLIRFNIAANSVSSLEPLRHLTQLSIMDANENNIPSLEPLRDHEKFSWLTVADNPGITDISPIGNYQYLQVFNIANNPVKDISILANANLVTMTNLSLDNTAIDDGDLPAISGMTNMLAVGIDGTGISDLSPLSGMSQLERLHLAQNNISSTGLIPIQGLTALKYLVLNENRIWEVTNLTGMTQLIDLHLRNQEYPPGLNCEQQQNIKAALPSTNVFVEDFWNDPNDDPDEGNINCFP